MKRVVETQLLDFCLQQKVAFGLSAWLDYPLPKEIKATAALYLANTSWFGYRKALLSVAERLHPGSVGHFSEMARLTGFDPSRFRGRLQARLLHEQGVS
jgi:hypothetical protein